MLTDMDRFGAPLDTTARYSQGATTSASAYLVTPVKSCNHRPNHHHQQLVVAPQPPCLWQQQHQTHQPSPMIRAITSHDSPQRNLFSNQQHRHQQQQHIRSPAAPPPPARRQPPPPPPSTGLLSLLHSQRPAAAIHRMVHPFVPLEGLPIPLTRKFFDVKPTIPMVVGTVQQSPTPDAPPPVPPLSPVPHQTQALLCDTETVTKDCEMSEIDEAPPVQQPTTELKSPDAPNKSQNPSRRAKGLILKAKRLVEQGDYKRSLKACKTAMKVSADCRDLRALVCFLFSRAYGQVDGHHRVSKHWFGRGVRYLKALGLPNVDPNVWAEQQYEFFWSKKDRNTPKTTTTTTTCNQTNKRPVIPMEDASSFGL